MALLDGKWVNKDATLKVVGDSGKLGVALTPDEKILRATETGLELTPNSVILPDGSVAFTSDQSIGGHRITDLGAPQAGTDAISLDYLTSVLDQTNTLGVEIETLVLTSDQITAKQVQVGYPILDNLPVSVHVVHGTTQKIGSDFRVDANDRTLISWSGLALDGKLETGDTLVITYSRAVAIMAPTEATQTAIKAYSIIPLSSMYSDDILIGTEPVRYLNVHDALQFSPIIDGGVLFAMTSTEFTPNVDVVFDLIFGPTQFESEVLTAGTVRFKAELFITGMGETEIRSTPDLVQTEDFNITLDMVNTVQHLTTTAIKIPGGYLSPAPKLITVRLFRENAVANNFTGAFCLLALAPKQAI